MPAPTTTLQAIETKVRRLTRSPSEALLTTLDLQNYINTFVVYDFPEHLRTFNLRKTFTFFTNPYQDEYMTDEASFGDATLNPTIVNNPLYNFQNNYLTVHPPVYIAGIQSMYTQSRQQFFQYYPKVNSVAFTGLTGDGVTNLFSGVVNSQNALVPANFNQLVGLLQREVLFNTVDSNLNGLALVDVPVIDPLTGNNTVYGNLYDPASAAYKQALITPPTAPNLGPLLPGTGVINYATGAFTLSFTLAPGPDAPINSQTVPQALAKPIALLYYANKFVIRPVPIQVYRVQIEVYQRPVALLSAGQDPELEEYWQYIAYGAAKKILEDRLDMESVQIITPEFMKQQNLCNRRTIVQYTNERTGTIFTEAGGLGNGGFGWGGNSNS